MSRSILIFAGVFVAVFAGGFLLMQQGNRGAPPLPLPPAADPPADAKAEPAKGPEPDEDDKPAAPRGPLVLKRWPLPKGLLPGSWNLDVAVAIDPTGPTVSAQTTAGAFAWDATTGATRAVARVEPQMVLKRSVSGSRLLVEVLDRKDKRKLLELKEAPTRDACRTPDGNRLIVVGNPSTYPSYTVIKIPSGESTVRPEERFKNVRLFDLANGTKLAEFGAKVNGLDDDFWAAAAAPDGQSFFLVNPRELIQVGFERAFSRPPLLPRAP